MNIDWSRYPNFREAEFRCSATGRCDMQPTILDALQALRSEYGRPLRVTSGYRAKTHPREAPKAEPGYHTKGLAVDVTCSGPEAFEIARLAFKHGFRGIGISQKAGLPRFVHLDMREGEPVIYSY